MMDRKSVLYILIFILAGCRAAQEPTPPATARSYAVLAPGTGEAERIRTAATLVPTPRQLRWQQLELTAFFHFGINTFTGREWGTGSEDPRLFHPTELDADQWVRVAKEAGIRQVILTAKHHDGFCLWPTRTTAHSVKSSPWKAGKGDVVREVAEACRRQGLGFGVYLSPWDRNAAVYGTEAYNDFFLEQLTELLTGYGRIDEVWFDGANGEGPNGKKQVYDFERWYARIRQLQPGAVIAVMGPDVRWVGTETGYGREQEWSVVPADNLDPSAVAAHSQQAIAFKPQGDMRGSDLGSREKIRTAPGLVWYPAETDVSIRPGWFYHEREDALVKTPEKLEDIYYHSVGRNGVLLLNIPPDRRGRIAEADQKSLRAWKSRIDRTFARNLLRSARVTPGGKGGARALVDDRYTTFWTTRGRDTTAVLEFSWKRPVTFDVLLLQENIAIGQRIEHFVLEYREGRDWKKVTEGTTVGYKRLLRFPAVTTRQLRLRLLSSRLNPTLSSLGLYKQP